LKMMLLRLMQAYNGKKLALLTHSAGV
jgi:hypothetical protein